MKITSAEFVTSAPDVESCPESSLGEVAFIGRSNVGKSSLINLLVHRDRLAKVSSTPGITAMINFFVVNDSWSMVDLPGYGYAKRSRTERDQFNEVVSDYLLSRPNLACLFILIDSKIPPQKIDLEYIEWVVTSRIPFALVFTKTDRTKPGALKKNIAKFKEALGEFCDGDPPTFTCSTKSKRSRFEVLDFIEQALSLRG